MLKNLRKKFNFCLLKFLNFLPIHDQYKFTLIYKYSLWNSPESKSGRGSELDRGFNFVIQMKKIISDYKIVSILDVPCGDLNLMQEVLKDNCASYTGMDIVRDLIQENKRNFGNLSNVNFEYGDARIDKINSYDLIICRDFLFHLSNKDIDSVINNLIKSKSKYLLVTTHRLKNAQRKNYDIKTGDFRFLDLFIAPISFPKPLMCFLDYEDDAVENFMCLFDFNELKKKYY